MVSNKKNNLVSSILGSLFLGFLAMLILIPLLFFVTFSFSSASEIHSFPKAFLPKLSFDLQVGYEEERYGLAVKNNEEEYELKIETNDLNRIKLYLSREFSVVKTTEELEKDFAPSKNGEPVELNYRKSMFYNFNQFFDIVPGALKGLKNSLVAAMWTILISTTLGSMAGYALARFKFKGKEATNLMILIVRMFPSMAISVPMIVILMKMGLSGSMIGLAIVYSIPNIGLTAWITRSIFGGIGIEMEEASHVFGASKLQTFMKITFPLALPGLAAAAMYAFLAAWNDSITALILTPSNPTLSLAIYKGLGSADIQLAAAGAIILVIPALVFTFIIKGKLTSLWGDVKV